jgi:UDP-glucose 4-epimerase
VADLADAHVLALKKLETEGRILVNLGNGNGFSVKEVIEAALRVTGHAIPVEMKPRRAGDPARLVASSERAKTELRWRPKHPGLEDIVASAWRWHQERFGQ